MKTLLNWLPLLSINQFDRSVAYYSFKSLSYLSAQNFRPFLSNRTSFKYNKNILLETTNDYECPLKNPIKPEAHIKESSISLNNVSDPNLFSTYRPPLPIYFGNDSNYNTIVSDLIMCIESLSIKVDLELLNTHLHAYFNSLPLSKGISPNPKNWFFWFEKYRITPDIVSYTIILNYIASKKLYNTANSLFNMMKLGKGGFPIDLLDRNIHASNNISANENVGKSVQGFNSITTPKQLAANHRLNFSNGSHHSNLYNLNSGLNYPHAQKIVKPLPKPNSVTYGVMIKMFADQGNIDKVVEVYGEMISNGIYPTSRLVNIIVFLLVKHNRLENAIYFWQNHKQFINRSEPHRLHSNKKSRMHRLYKYLYNEKPDIDPHFFELIGTDFFLARQIVSKLISSCFNKKVEILPLVQKILGLNIESYPRERYMGNRMRIIMAFYLFLDFNREFPTIFHGSLGTKIFNIIFKFSLKNHHQYLCQVKLNKSDCLFTDTMCTFYGIKSLNDIEIEEHEILEQNSNKNFTSNRSCTSTSINNTNTQHLKRDTSSVDEEQNSNQSEEVQKFLVTSSTNSIIDQYTLLVQHTITHMISSNISPNFDILTHSLPALLRNDKNTKYLDLLFLKILKSTENPKFSNDIYENSSDFSAKYKPAVDSVQNPTSTDTRTTVDVSNYNPATSRPIIICENVYLNMVDIAKVWRAETLLIKWMDSNNIYISSLSK
ncbi:putative pentatricopeptide repeat-containing protein [Smittium culicis]|uniref:Putative pentatricopeptide repeat-containing protein n=1 Tax=Smittium culicis TaxID=133412 RepID=A0A1R1YJU1_9FUNG|nr:putative pentatricopeptide repeat-containing protein [Smittium culicis]